MTDRSGTPSKSAINRAGETLISCSRAGEELPLDACELVTKWRETHAEPLVWLTMSLRGRTEMPASYRLKRLPQIVQKLERAGNMNLARMQDIGGSRVVVSSRTEADRVLEAITRRTSPWYQVERVTDYRREGRQVTGYRAVHVIVRRDGRLLEIQVRTRREHAWAEAVERAANRTGFRLKDGEGPSDLVDYFRFASDCLARLDEGGSLSSDERREFLRRDGVIARHFPDQPRNGEPRFEVRGKTLTTRENNWLLVFNWKKGGPESWMDCGTDCIAAAQTYSEWEQRYPWREGYEVVLIGSDSRDTIEWTHAHYFGRSADDIDPHGVLEELRAA